MIRSHLISAVFVLGAISSAVTPVLALPKNTIVATISAGNTPDRVVVSPNSQVAYVANLGPGTVSVIDAATNTVTATIPLGTFPNSLAITPNGQTVYAGNGSSETVSVISTATNSVIATVPITGNVPRGLAVSPDGTTVYIATSSDSTRNASNILIIDTSTNQLSSSAIPIKGNGFQVAFTPSGQEAYVGSFTYAKTNTWNYFFSRVDTSTLTVLGSMQIKQTPVPPNETGFNFVINPAGTQVYLAEYEGMVAVFSTTTNKIFKRISEPDLAGFSDTSAVTPDGKYLYMPVGGSVAMTDVATRRYVSSFPINSGDGTPVAMAVAPNGNYAYVCDYSDAFVYVVDISGS